MLQLYEDTKNAEIYDTEDIVQHSKQDASSSLVEGELVEKNSKEDESKGMQSKDQVRVKESLNSFQNVFFLILTNV